jgi:hypothetical protein
MATTISLYTKVSFSINGEDHEAGSLTTPNEISIAGDVMDVNLRLSASGTSAIWVSGTSSGPTNFDFLWLDSDGQLEIELTCDKDNDNGDEYLHLHMFEYGPFILCSDNSIAARTAAFTGTADVIDQIKIKNPSATETREVRIIVAS